MGDEQEREGLLERDNTDSDAATQVSLSSSEEDVEPNPRGFSPWLACLIIALFLGVLALPLLGSTLLGRLDSTNPLNQLAIQLHPDEHATREPTTLTFNWTVTLGARAPDGVEKQVYLVNGQFPGPTIEGRSGDRIIVHVHNALQDQGVSLHWHGLRMQGFNKFDGAVGFTQCPIPPGGDFTYDYRIGDDEFGTFWWHSHSQLQRADGLFGGLVVHQPRHADVDMSGEGDSLLLVGDWFHRKQTDVLAWYANAGSLGNEPVPDSLVINGHGRYNCSMAVPARPVQCSPVALASFPPLLQRHSGRTRLRVVNTGTIAGLTLMVDGATLIPIEVDGGCSVNAQPSSSVGILYPGERVDLMLDWSETHSAQQPWLNIYLDDENFGFANPALNPNHTFPALPDTLVAVDQDEGPLLNFDENHQDLGNLTSTEGPSRILPWSTEETFVFYIKSQKLAVNNNRPLGFINHTVWQPQALPLLSQQRSSWDEHQFIPFIGTTSKPTQVKVVLNNLDDGSHPFHLHGHSFYILSSFRAENRDGYGSYNPYETPEDETPGHWDRNTPLRKDTVSVPRRGHVVLTFMADNPGLWMLHCHMLVHQSTGMATGFHVGVIGDEEHTQGLDASAAQLCSAAKE